MRLIDFFDRGVGINPSRICLKDATVSRTFRDESMRMKLRQNSDPAALHAVLTERRSTQAA